MSTKYTIKLKLKTSTRRTQCGQMPHLAMWNVTFLLPWPWPWPDDLHVQTWLILPEDTCILDAWKWTSQVPAFKSYRITDIHKERQTRPKLYKKLIRRWDSERELSLRRHRTRTTNYNRLVHKFRHRSTRRLCVGTYVYQIQWNNAM